METSADDARVLAAFLDTHGRLHTMPTRRSKRVVREAGVYWRSGGSVDV